MTNDASADKTVDQNKPGDQDKPGELLEFRFFTEVGIIEQLARNALERVLPDGLTLSQFTVLNHFARRGGKESPVQLARAFQVTKGAMTNTVQKLEAKGFILVEPDAKDRRAKLVSITEAGLVARGEAILCLSPIVERARAALGNTPFAEALPHLERVRVWLDADRDSDH